MANINEIKVKHLPLGGDKTLYDCGLTIVHPFFGEIKRFNTLFDNYWSRYPEKIKDKLHIIVVDDCGTPPIHDLMVGRVCDFNLTIFRITENLKYNTPGALNVGSVEAKTDFILQLDSDCILEPDMMDKLMTADPLPNFIYKFVRNRITDNIERKRTTRYLPCANLLHKNIFTVVGGFDEDFTGSRSGGYGFFDTHFDHKIRKNGFCKSIIDGVIITEYMESLNEPGRATGPLGVGVHRTGHHEAINFSLCRAKQANPLLNNNNILRFQYKKVYEHKRL